MAEAYGLNQPMEWAPVFWALMLKPDLMEQFVAEFVAILPLQPSMLQELARFVFYQELRISVQYSKVVSEVYFLWM